jgi:hypothetical protein
MSAAMLKALPAQNAAAPYRWSGAYAVPEIGERVTISFNGLGAGKVVGYKVVEGWLGVFIQLEKNPEWRAKQGQSLSVPAFVFGAELLEQRAPKAVQS